MKNLYLFIITITNLLACNSAVNNGVQKNKKGMANQYDQVNWMHSTNVYEVNIRQYSKEGTFNAFAPELPRLKAMGVKTLWFMPITPIAQLRKKGSLGSPYAAADYMSINPEFGTIEDFKKLVEQAHGLGFKVIIDWVANHTGWDHVWTKEHPTYYLKDETTRDFKIASGMDDIIELDYKNPALRAAMIQAMEYWIKDCDIDGFRCDLATWVELDFWKEARDRIQTVKKIFWLGEFDPIENPDYMQAFDAAYTWKWMHATEDYYKKKTGYATVDSLLHQYDTAGGEGAIKLWFTTNHDENSWNGTEYEKYGDMSDALTVFSFTRNGIPLVYSGQELPNNKRLEFFEKDPIAWNGRYEKAAFYKTLYDLRSSNKALDAGMVSNTISLSAATDSSCQKPLIYLRHNGTSQVLVMLNLSADSCRFSITNDKLNGTYQNVFNTADKIMFNENKGFTIQPWGYLVYQKQ